MALPEGDPAESTVYSGETCIAAGHGYSQLCAITRGQGAGGSRRSIMRIETIKREARGIALAVLLVAVTTVIADALVLYLGIRRGSVIYLLAVLVSGWRFGLWPAIVAAVAVVLGSGVLFTPRIRSAPSCSIWLCSSSSPWWQATWRIR